MDSAQHHINTSDPGGLESDYTLLLPRLQNEFNPPWLQHYTRLQHTVTVTGYQLWAVEQYITNRNALLPFVIVLTGDDHQDKVTFDRYVLADFGHDLIDRHWERTRDIFRNSKAKLHQTSNGWIPLTRLPSLDPDLNLVQIPEGDYLAVMSQLYANINLRRLGLGGRSGLRLMPPSPAQRFHFHHLFRLPQSPSNKSASIDESFDQLVLSLIALVQNALSVFGLGPVLVSPTLTYASLNEQHLTSLTERRRRPYAEPWDGGEASNSNSDDDLDSIASALEAAAPTSISHALSPFNPDGLLCDTTLAALFFFRAYVVSPTLRIIDDTTSRNDLGTSPSNTSSSIPLSAAQYSNSALCPSLLAALLSTTIAARARLAYLHQHHGNSSVPRDVFARPRRFLQSLDLFMRAGQRHGQISVLTRSNLAKLGHAWARERALEEHGASGTASKVSRALKNRINAAGREIMPGQAFGQDGVEHVAGAGGDEDGSEAETANIDAFVHLLQHRGVGGATVLKLWGVELKSRSRSGGIGRRARKTSQSKRERLLDEQELQRDRNRTADEAEALTPGGGASDAEVSVAGASLGIGRSVLKGVKDRAGRAGRLLNDSLGFTESPVASRSGTLRHGTGSQALPESDVPSRQTSIDPASQSRAGSLAARVASALNSPVPGSMSSNEGLAGTRTGTTRETLSPAASIRQRLPVVPTANGRRPHASSKQAPLTDTVADPAVRSAGINNLSSATQRRLQGPRRIASDHAALPTLGSPVLDEEDNENSSVNADDAAARARLLVQHHHHPGRPRRHSFNVMRDAPEPWQNLSRKRLVLDFNLRVTLWTLHLREKKLAGLRQALQTVKTSYDEAISSLEPVLAMKSTQLESLTDTALALARRAESYASPASSPTAKLATGSSRLHYAQSIVEDKLGDITDFQRMVALKVGPGGTLDEGIRSLETERSGIRSLVVSLERWTEWLGFLTLRGAHHLRIKRDNVNDG